MVGIALLAAVAWGGEERVRWVGPLDRALEQAREKRLPVLVAINTDRDGEGPGPDGGGNTRMVYVHYRDAEVVALSRHFVCVIASPNVHEEVAEPGKVCSRFGDVPCAAHVASEAGARAAWFAGVAKIVAPQHLFLDSSGKLLLRKEYEVEAKDLIALMLQALYKASPAVYEAVAEERYVEAARALRGADDEARRSAAHELATSPDPRAASVLRKAILALKEEADRARLVRAAGSAPGPAVEGLFAELLADKSTRVRAAAAAALGRIATPGSTTALAAALKREKEPEGKNALLRALGERGSDPAVAAVVLPLLGDKSAQVRTQAALALAGARGEAAGAAKLLAMAREEHDVRARCAAILALAGQESREASAVFERMREKERDPFVTRALDASLDRLHGRGNDAWERAMMLLRDDFGFPGPGRQ